MNINHRIHQYFTGPSTYKIDRSKNHLGINRIDYIKDKYREHLILLVSFSQLVGPDIYVFMKRCNLCIEAPILPDFIETPVRIHLVGKEDVDECLNNGLDIGFSEVKLNSGFYYKVLDYEVINPGFMKIILSCRPVNNKKNIN